MKMPNDKALREQLVKLLTGSEAHADFDAAVKNFPADLRGKKPESAEHSPWQLLEHMRIAQWDILEYAISAKHKSPEFPEGYWPASPSPASAKDWENSVRSFKHDLKRLCDLVSADSTDLYAKIPHGEGQTILRQALLTADHNAYHMGQLVLVRKMLGAWQ
jgi:hypothetical protein